MNLDAALPTIRKTRITDFNASFTIQDVHLKKIENGSLDYDTALLQGRLIITGDEGLAKKVVDIFQRIHV